MVLDTVKDEPGFENFKELERDIKNDIDDEIVISHHLWVQINKGISKDLRNLRKESIGLEDEKKEEIANLITGLKTLRSSIQPRSDIRKIVYHQSTKTNISMMGFH